MKELDFPLEIVEDSGLVDNLLKFFDASRLGELARSTKFVQRSTSHLNGLAFLSLHVFEKESLLDSSLNDACAYLSDKFDIKLSKQSLDERYNTYAVGFMKNCFSSLLKEVLVKHGLAGVLGSIFKRVRIADSCGFKLPGNLSPFYQGPGGDTGGAAIKLHHEYDVVSGDFIDLRLGPGIQNDAKFLPGSPAVEPGDLLIMDLGYYKLEHFESTSRQGGFFLSRYKFKTGLYRGEDGGGFTPVGLGELMEGVTSPTSFQLYAGKGNLKVRVLLAPVPEKVEKERLALLSKKAKHKKWNISEERKALCKFNVFISNIGEDVSDQELLQLYSLRWQIELIFKVWKSVFKIHEVGHTNIFRFECYLYGRLIALCLGQNIQNLFKEHFLRGGFEPSEWKSFKVFKKN
jgi:hypothetical protein